MPPSVPPWAWRIPVALLASGVFCSLPIQFRVRVTYRGPGRGDKAVFEMSLFGGLSVWRVVLPLLRLDRSGEAPGVVAFIGRAIGSRYRSTRREAEEQPEKEVITPREAKRTAGFMLNLGRELTGPSLALARKVRWSRLSWETTVGLSDAAQTALAAGALWAIKGGLAAAARRKLYLAPGLPAYSVTPDFSGRGTVSRLDGIGVLRVGHIIFALPGLALALHRLWRARRGNRRQKSGRRSSWPNTPFRA
jgi:hypothetical protein